MVGPEHTLQIRLGFSARHGNHAEGIKNRIVADILGAERAVYCFRAEAVAHIAGNRDRPVCDDGHAITARALDRHALDRFYERCVIGGLTRIFRQGHALEIIPAAPPVTRQPGRKSVPATAAIRAL